MQRQRRGLNEYNDQPTAVQTYRLLTEMITWAALHPVAVRHGPYIYICMCTRGLRWSGFLTNYRGAGQCLWLI
jgi:hypothetical protein